MHDNVNIPRSAINGAIWMFLASISQIIAQITLIAVLAHLLTPTDFGVVSLILIFANFSYLFTAGIGVAIVQSKELEKNYISTGYSISILLGTVLAIIFFLLARPISVFFKAGNLVDALRFFSFLPIKSFSSVTESILRKRMRFSLLAKCSTISYIAGFGITSIVLAFLGFGLWAMIYGQLIQLVLYSVLLLFFERPVIGRSLNLKTAKSIINFAGGYTLSAVFNFLAENSDNTIAGRILGLSVLGLYSRAFQLLAIPSSFFGTIFDNVLLPILSSKQANKAKLSSFYAFALSFCFIILSPLSIFLSFNSNLLISTLLGHKWAGASKAFEILIFSLAFRFGTRINKSFITSLGFVYKGAYYQMIFATMVISFCLIGSKKFGIEGLAYGVLLASIIHYFHTSFKLIKVLLFSLRQYIVLHIRLFTISVPILLLFGFSRLAPSIFTTYFSVISSTILLIASYISFLHSRNTLLFNTNNNLFIYQMMQNLPAIIKTMFVKFRIQNILAKRLYTSGIILSVDKKDSI